MNIKLSTLSEILEISAKEIHRLIANGKIPCYQINAQYRFNLSEIIEWLLIQHHHIADPFIDYVLAENPIKAIPLFERGSISYGIPLTGTDKEYTALMAHVAIPPSASIVAVEKSLRVRNSLTTAALNTEFGALHPRNPLFSFHREESISICTFTEHYAIDDTRRSSVRTVFINFSANPARHLEIRLFISYLCQFLDFSLYFEKEESRERILSYIDDHIYGRTRS